MKGIVAHGSSKTAFCCRPERREGPYIGRFFTSFRTTSISSPFFRHASKYALFLLLLLTILISPVSAATAADAKITAIYFYEPGCPYCARFESGPLKDPAVIKELSTLEWIKVNPFTNAPIEFMGSKVNQDMLATRYGANFFPTVTFVNADGKVIANIRGYFETPDFLEMARYVTEGHYTQETFEAYLARKARGG